MSDDFNPREWIWNSPTFEDKKLQQIQNNMTDDIALTVACPVCNAPEDSPCVYIWPKGVRECEFTNELFPDICQVHSDKQHERLEKVGALTKASHSKRKNIVYKRSVRQRQLEELTRLRNWLLQYGSIFEERDG